MVLLLLTLLHFMVRSSFSDLTKLGNRKFLKALLEHNANVEDTDNNGATLFHLACRKDRTKIVKFLIKTGKPDINVKDKNLDTPLHIAAFEGAKKCVQLLIAKVMSNICDS